MASNRRECGTGERPSEATGTPFSAREAEVVGLVAEGLSGREIARRLCRSQRTVESHIRSVYRKLGARNRVGMLRIATERGLLDGPAPFRWSPSAELELKGRALEVLREIDDRVAGASTGRYFGELAKALCSTLAVRWAGVTQASPGSEELDIIALAADGRLDPKTRCRRPNSPCGATLEHGEVLVLDGLERHFPAWPFLKLLPVRAYVGLRLDHRLLGVVGSIWVMDDKPLESAQFVRTVLRFIAKRTAAELGLAKTLGDPSAGRATDEAG